MKKSIILILSVMMIFYSCKTETDTNTIDGVWESIGYGRILKVDSGEFLLADATDTSCIPVMDGNISDFSDKINVINDTLYLKDGINNYAFTKLSDAPQPCKGGISEEQKKDPIFNFEVLANTFKHHYAYFNERNIDWDKTYTEYRSKITKETTEVELYQIMKEMLDAFGDGHISLSASDDIETAAANLDQEENAENDEPKVKRYSRNKMANAIAKKYIENGKTRHNKFMRWGILEDSVGYLQVNQMMGYANYGISDTLSRREYYMTYFEKAGNSLDSGKDELDGIKPTIKEVMTDLKDTKAIIIDLRFNGGGDDLVGMTILSQFNDTERVVFTKKAKHKNSFTKDNVVKLTATENAYIKPVYLLIGDGSASATEIMTLSSLTLNHITRIGSNTNGVFSDILDKTLPNGWEFGLSNEVYLDTKGNNYEGVGIAPDINMGYGKDAQKQYTAIMQSLDTEGDKAIETVKSLVKSK